ncbi:MAG: hypothetical protein ACE15F_24250 [bacterium]
MKTYTKRGMELIIVLTVCLLALSTWHERRVANRQREQALELATLLNQTLWDKYGPGTKQGYRDLLGSDPYTTFNLGDDRSQAVSVFDELNQVENLVGNAGAILAVPEAPEWYQSRLKRAEEWAVQLPPVLEKGPYLAAPGEIYFATTALNSFWSSIITQKANGMKQLALRDWMHGNRDQAITRLVDIIRLGDALRFSPVAWEQLMRTMVIEIGLDGFDTVLWTNPGPEDNQKILAALRQFKPEEWYFPSYVENILWTDYSDYAGRLYRPDTFAAILMLNGVPDPQRVPKIDDLYHEIGLIPDWRIEQLRGIPKALVFWDDRYARFFKQRGSRKTAALLEKWTTLPAMRKRMQNLPDWFYESDPLLSADNARRFPPLVYAASRFCTLFAEPYYQTNALTRLLVARQRMAALTAAFWGRCQRDTKGAWLSSEEFADQFDKQFQWTVNLLPDRNNTQLVEAYLARHQVNKRFYLDETKTEVNPGDHSEINFPMKWYEQEIIAKAEIPSVTATREELENWVRGIFQNDPLVETIQPHHVEVPGYYHPSNETILAVKSYQVKLKLPKTSYWVVQTGPDGISDLPFLPYNPTNGAQSRGDILQLAGWE